jgi:hypothetical protein
MKSSATQMLRAGVFATVVGIAFTAGGSGTGAADPANNTSPLRS